VFCALDGGKRSLSGAGLRVTYVVRVLLGAVPTVQDGRQALLNAPSVLWRD
jgi:hypothetical protein